MKRVIATGAFTGGCYFLRLPGVTAVRTSRQPVHRVRAEARGRGCVAAYVGDAVEIRRCADEAALARWACRLAVELGGAVELVLTTKEQK